MNLDEATIDRLRELGATDDMMTWLAHPSEVRALLKLSPYNGAERCDACDEDAYDAHLCACPIAAAWRALGDPRGQADLERAREEADWEDERRDRERRLREAGLNASAASIGESPAAQWRRHNASLSSLEDQLSEFRRAEEARRNSGVTFAGSHRGPSDAWLALPEETRRRFPYVDTSGAKKPK